MFKKVIAYQRILLNSISMDGNYEGKPTNIISFFFVMFLSVFLEFNFFLENYSITVNLFIIPLAVISVWFINTMARGEKRIFETVPVSRKFIAFNIFLFSGISFVVMYLTITILGIAFILSLMGFLYLFFPQHIGSTPPNGTVPEEAYQLANTTQSYVLMILIVVLILFIGTTIVFIKNRKIRIACFAGFSALGYTFMLLLKSKVSKIANFDKLGFYQGFSIMKQANAILIVIGIITALICFLSVLTGYKLYTKKNIKDLTYCK
ncbi:MAG: hypothetical protein ACERKV_09230 [Clostridiaceae bacterium]